MRSWLELVTAPSTEPLTLLEAQQQVRRFDGDENDSLTDLIKAARDYVETVTGRQLITATYRLRVDGWGCAIEIPRPPLVTGSVTVGYLDTSGAAQTLATTDYLVTVPSGPRATRGVIEPAYGVWWPATYGQAGAVSVTFQAGYGPDGSFVPPALKRAMRLLIGHWYANASGVEVGTIASAVPLGVVSLLAPFISRDTVLC